MALRAGRTHVLQWRRQWDAKGAPGTPILKAVSVRIASATRMHEVGIASNRGSACLGEYVPGLYTRPYAMGVGFYPKMVR